MVDLNRELQHIEQGDAWEESDEVVQVEVKRPLDKVVPIRLPAAAWTKLREEARELGVGPTTLARMWILERLRIRSISPQDAFRFFKLLTPSFFRESPPSPLTPREAEVLEYVARGCTNKELAEKLGISEGTIKRHLSAILSKLNAPHEYITYEKSKQEV